MHDPRPQLKSLVADYPQIKLALIFGSFAAGTAIADSDIDLAVLADAPLDKKMRVALIARIAKELGRPVDLVDMRTAGVVMLGEVFKGERLLGDDALFAEQLCRYLIDREDFLPLRRRILRERRAAWTE